MKCYMEQLFKKEKKALFLEKFDIGENWLVLVGFVSSEQMKFYKALVTNTTLLNS